MAFQTLDQAEQFFKINDKVPIPLSDYHKYEYLARVKRILNYISTHKVLIKYDLFINQEDILIHWENRPESNL